MFGTKSIMEIMSGIIKKIYAKCLVLSFDMLAIPLAWYLAYWLRYNMPLFPKQVITPYSLISLAILSVLQIASYYHFNVYRGLWRYSSLNDVERILKAVISAVILIIPILYLSSISLHIPRSILPLYGILLCILLLSGRLASRWYWTYHGHHREAGTLQRVLIIGAGRAGESLIRDLNQTDDYIPVGLLDDNLAKQGLEIRGVRVLGLIEELVSLVVLYKIDLIFIAIPSANSAVMRRIVNLCECCKIPFRTLPTLQALVDGRVELNALREVQLEDLLGRDQIKLDWDNIWDCIHQKRILVTGAGGSIGSELCRQIAVLNPEKIVLVDNSEFNLYKIEAELKQTYTHVTIEKALVNVVDQIAVEHVFQRHQPQIVFHAAAYKHVPMLEDQVRVAVQNNVIGTRVVAEASVAIHAEKFILISTDKAVNPSNIMGTTKRVAEIYCQNLNERVSTQFITVRFGNVLGSVGSVVPLFQQQLKNGGPLTVTHPDMKRYFMTIAEACQLILQAMVNGLGGEIFVLDMGEPIKISYLAEQMIRLVGKEPGKDIDIIYTGLRPGEKMYEELFHASEELTHTAHDKLFKAKFRQIDWNELSLAFRLINIACAAHQDEELLILLRNLVPEFSYQALALDASTQNPTLIQ